MKKRFDCVAMKREAQEEILKHLKGKSVEEQFALANPECRVSEMAEDARTT